MPGIYRLISAFVVSFSFIVAAGTAQAGGDKDWAGMYGGFTSAFLGASSPQDNFPGGLKKKVGGSAGLLVGWNHVTDQFLFGVEGDAQVASMILHRSEMYFGKREVQITSTSSIRARAGMIFGEDKDYLVYATGGVAFTGVETEISPFIGRDVQDSRVVAGFAVGGGLETWLFGNDWITTSFEYLYTNVPSKSYKSGYGYNGGGDKFEIEEQMHSYKFKAGIHQLRGAWNVHF